MSFVRQHDDTCYSSVRKRNAPLSLYCRRRHLLSILSVIFQCQFYFVCFIRFSFILLRLRGFETQSSRQIQLLPYHIVIVSVRSTEISTLLANSKVADYCAVRSKIVYLSASRISQHDDIHYRSSRRRWSRRADLPAASRSFLRVRVKTADLQLVGDSVR